MSTDKEPTVTVRFTLTFERTIKLRQDNKPTIYSNVEWAKQQLEDIANDAEFTVDGQNKRCEYFFSKGNFPDEIATD